MYYKQLLIIIACLMIGWIAGNIPDKPDYKQDIGQSKSVKVSKARYFFVGYHIENSTKHANGSLQWFCYDGLMPNKKEVCKFLQKEVSNMEFSFDQFVIVGLHEFKNKTECEQFFEMQKQK